MTPHTPHPLIAAAVLTLAVSTTGCMFHIEHRMPVEATFGRDTDATAERTEFSNTRVKRYLLGGVIPWSFSYGSSSKLVDEAPGRRIENLEILTRFSFFDMALRVVPYLSYVLAQRTVEVRGVYVDHALPLRAESAPSRPLEAASAPAPAEDQAALPAAPAP